MSDWLKIREKIIDRIKPSEGEEITLRSIGDQVIIEVNEILDKSGIQGRAELHGSVSHGTWIKGQMDLDVFIVLENYKERSQLRNVIQAIKDNLDWDFTTAYAEHPYLQTVIDGINIDLVPCFRVEKGEGIISSTDRTPLHTEWLKGKIEEHGDEVRLLKQFLKVVEIYGAEIKIGGFSGYLCELLILKYGSFMKVIEAASEWGNQQVVKFNEETKKFDDPLIVYDPVDQNRNVAAALRSDSYQKFIKAAKGFKENPRRIFFVYDTSEVDVGELVEKIRSTNMVFLVIEESNAEVPDVLWGQIWKSINAIERKLCDKGFEVLQSSPWSNDKTRHVFSFQLTSLDLPEVYKHFGPSVNLTKNVEQFKAAYMNRSDVVEPPTVEEGRWYVVKKRETTNIKEIMEEMHIDGGRRIGVSQKLAIKILQHHRVLVGEEIEPYLEDGFTRHLYNLLRGRPFWVD